MLSRIAQRGVAVVARRGAARATTAAASTSPFARTSLLLSSSSLSPVTSSSTSLSHAPRRAAAAAPSSASLPSDVSSAASSTSFSSGAFPSDNTEGLISASISMSSRKLLADIRGKKPELAERMASAQGLYVADGPGQHSSLSVGQYYPVDTSRLPELFKKPLEEELKVSGGYAMIRQTAVQLVALLSKFADPAADKTAQPYSDASGLKTTTSDKPANAITVIGHRGTGKTFALAYALEYALQNDWLVLASTGREAVDDFAGMIYPSETRERIFYQPLKSASYLANLVKTQGATLQKIPLQAKGVYDHPFWHQPPSTRFMPPTEDQDADEAVPFPNPEEVPRPAPNATPKTLFDLACIGAWRHDVSAEALYALMGEAMQTTAVPVLVALDNANWLDHKSEFLHPTRYYRLDTRRLSFADTFAATLSLSPARGAVVCALTSDATYANGRSYLERAGTVLQTHAYDGVELQNVLDHYSVSRYIYTPLDMELLRRLEALTGGVPRDVRTVCVSW